MTRYPNLSDAQHLTQRFADAFNADEAHWRALAPLRHRRRKLFRLTKKQLDVLDRIEFAATRAVEDCVGQSQGER